MVIGQFLFGVYHSVQISLHQLRHYIYVVEALRVLRHENLVQLDDVFVSEKTKQFYFSVYPLRVYKVFEGVFHFFYGNFAFFLCVFGRGDDAVSAATHHLDELELSVDVEFGGWLDYRRRGRCGVALWLVLTRGFSCRGTSCLLGFS